VDISDYLAPQKDMNCSIELSMHSHQSLAPLAWYYNLGKSLLYPLAVVVEKADGS
jgi:hypothetical protein